MLLYLWATSEMHDTKFYFLREKDQKIVTRDFIVSVVYDFFELFFLFKAQHIFISETLFED